MAHRVFRFNLASPTEHTFTAIKSDPHWLHHCFPVMALQKPVMSAGCVDIMETFSRLKSCKYDYEGEEILGTQILALWNFLLNTNRSSILKESQTKHTSLSAAVPLILYAYKLVHDTPYEAWSSNPLVGDILGKDIDFLAHEDVRNFECPWNEEALKHIRTIALTENARDLRMPDTSNKMNKLKSKYTEEASEIFDPLPKLMKYMVLQTWVYHPSIRSDRMITDWKNWDSLKPSVYGSSVTAKAEKSSLFDGIEYKFEPEKKRNSIWDTSDYK